MPILRSVLGLRARSARLIDSFVSRRCVNVLPVKRKDPEREARITEEIVVDAYHESERALGWYYYLGDRLKFPFQAKCLSRRARSPLKRGETVLVERLAAEDECMKEVIVMVRWSGRRVGVPLAQLSPVNPDQKTELAISDWHYWVDQGYSF